MGRKVRLSESQLHRIIKETARRVMSEDLFSSAAKSDYARQLGGLEAKGNIYGSRDDLASGRKFDRVRDTYNRTRDKFFDLSDADGMKEDYVDYPEYKQGRNAFYKKYDSLYGKRGDMTETYDAFCDEDDDYDEFYADDRRGHKSQGPRKMRRDFDGGYTRRGRY